MEGTSGRPAKGSQKINVRALLKKLHDIPEYAELDHDRRVDFLAGMIVLTLGPINRDERFLVTLRAINAIAMSVLDD